MMTVAYLSWCVILGSIHSLLHFAEGQILSRNKAVTMSSTFEYWVGSRAVDGNYNTRAADCQCCAATNLEPNPWIKLNLGHTSTITRILVYSRSDNHLDSQNITGLTIRIDDGREFKPPSNRWYEYDTFFNYAFPTPITTRTVIFLLPGERYFIICEVDVIYDKIISLNKPVTMNSQFQNWGGSRAVDGDLRTDAFPCDCCAATRCGESSWLRVDLGAQYVIYYVTIYGRTDGTYPGQSFEGMSIEFDNRVVQTIPLRSVFKNTTKFYEFRSKSTAAVKNVTLRLSNNAILCPTQLLVCELVLHGVCPTGTYGQGCRNRCGFCRYGGECHMTDGNCEACDDGLDETDLTCKTECPDGWYGKNCSQKCGNCINNEKCTKFDGHCSSCNLGYDLTDKTCKTACQDGFYGNCTSSCGHCLNNDVCIKNTGVCPNGCEPGFEGDACTSGCVDGHFGYDCKHCCGMCKGGDVCNTFNGKCPNGCADGYHGDLCQSEELEPKSSVSIPVFAGSLSATLIVAVLLTL